MAFAPDVYQKIADRLRERRIIGGEPTDRWKCWFCGDSRWTLGDGFVTVDLGHGSSPFQPSGNQLPSLALVCQTCGNTVLLNLLILGLGDLIGAPQPGAFAQPA